MALDIACSALVDLAKYQNGRYPNRVLLICDFIAIIACGQISNVGQNHLVSRLAALKQLRSSGSMRFRELTGQDSDQNPATSSAPSAPNCRYSGFGTLEGDAAESKPFCISRSITQWTRFAHGKYCIARISTIVMSSNVVRMPSNPCNLSVVGMYSGRDRRRALLAGRDTIKKVQKFNLKVHLATRRRYAVDALGLLLLQVSGSMKSWSKTQNIFLPRLPARE
ncbi:hypothetical protein [Mesorhizobium helmanticense]|uniref:Uncharacterized protein n=1 Tax=Mesorhizobium helmanticense TaxID=1776423 RepID=A0A2T4IKU4_9HYPH|nr:hypothetical protein [Mesorhizobium helmanticense]PTE06249.1 hypothetical protein C9427_32840 [Mesorhizobium helmanticense]